MSDYIIRATAAEGQIRAFAATTKELTEFARQAHNTSPVATAALGRLLTAGAMMGVMMKGADDILTIKIEGDGPIGGLTVTADSKGDVKGYAYNPEVMLPPNEKGKLDVGGAVGTDGTLSVVKDLGMKEPYVGVVPLVSGEIAEDVAQYFATSEQTPTVCGLGVLVNPDLTVNVAGGFLIEVLPFASDACIDTIENNLKNLPPVTTMMSQGMTPDQIALRLLDGLEPNLLDEGEVKYQCDCSRERTERVLKALGNTELSKLAEEGEPITVNCHFCGKEYKFTPDELQKLCSEEEE